MLKRRTFLTYSVLFMGGCTFATTATSQSKSKLNRPNQLRFAVTDVSGAKDLERDFGAFRQAMEEVLSIPVTFYPVENYSAAAPALLANELDFAMAGPSEYLLLRARSKAVSLVGVSRPHYYSVIMTRVDSGLNTLADLKGKKIAMRTQGSTAGHIIPMKLLLDAGLAPEGDYEVLMLDKAGFAALRSGKVDAWAGSSIYSLEYVKDPAVGNSEVQVIARSSDLPPDVFVANPILTHKNTLMTALLASEANQKYKDSEPIPVHDNDYQSLRDSYHAIGQSSAIE